MLDQILLISLKVKGRVKDIHREYVNQNRHADKIGLPRINRTHKGHKSFAQNTKYYTETHHR